VQGPLPASWGALGNLTTLVLTNSRGFGTLPSAWSSMSKLKTLQMQQNQLSGGLQLMWPLRQQCGKCIHVLPY
jgi:hypothetical protein